MNNEPDIQAYDALVVGMGPAGAVAACELSRASLSVLALDKQRHPRYKVCGGGLSARIESVLDWDVRSLVEHTVYGVEFSYTGGEPFLIESPTPIAYMVAQHLFPGPKPPADADIGKRGHARDRRRDTVS